MSWRLIIGILAACAATSVWGGLQLGEWLVAHGPVAAAAPGRPELAPVPVLDANGKPFSAQPPQPLVNGRLAIQQALPEVSWQIADQGADDTLSSAVISVSTTPITTVEAQQIASLDQGRLNGIADVGDLINSMGGKSGNKAMPVQRVDMPDPTVTQAPVENDDDNAAPANLNGNWRAQLRSDLQACQAESFFDRPSCMWSARNKYCTPNNAWGKIEDCPDKRF